MYLIGDWVVLIYEALSLYIDHEVLETDNNLVEPQVEKYILFSGSPNSGETRAVIFRLLETCS